MITTAYEYWEGVKSIAAGLVDEAMLSCDNKDDAIELINDSLLHEVIDGHQWIIYCAYNLPVLQHSDNADYMVDNIGGLEESLSQGLSVLHTHLAYWALYADVQDMLLNAFDEEAA